MNDISQTSKNCIFHDILSKDMDKELDKNWTYVIFSVLKRRITMVPGAWFDNKCCMRLIKSRPRCDYDQQDQKDMSRLSSVVIQIQDREEYIFSLNFDCTVLATKTRLLTLKSNISPLMESKTKLNIPIFFLVKSSYIFW